MTDATDIQQRAAEAAKWFTAHTEGDRTWIVLKDERPQWVQDIVYAAHNGWSDFLPDDYRYQWTWDALEYIATADDPDDGAEFADSAVDVYTGARLQWLASNLNRPTYCDDAAAEFGPSDDIVAMIGLGQYMEASEVYSLVLAALSEVSAEVESLT